MRALRLVLHQNSANYKKEEAVDNKMTYPLPPISTIIGALHNACDYKEYHNMDICILGKYESMHREPYTDYCFLNNVQDDRGILVKMKNGDLLSTAFERVASAQKPQGNSFRKGETINIHNFPLLQEYRDLKDLNDEIITFKKERIQPVMDLIKKRKKTLSEKKKGLDKKCIEYQKIIKRESELKDKEKYIKERLTEFVNTKYDKPISLYRSLTTSLKFYEILDGIDLILYVKSSEDTLHDILDHIDNLRSIGRSEDTVDVEDVRIVNLKDDTDEDEIICAYSAYIDYNLVKDKEVFVRHKIGEQLSGTRYYLNKKYEIQDGKRVFEKKKVIYTSNFAAEDFGDRIYWDQYKGENLIVSFV